MNVTFMKKEAGLLIFQRNVSLALNFILTCTLLISLSLLFVKNQKVIVTPAMIEKEFWIDSKTVSSTYLEQYALFIGKLLFEKSSHSAATQRDTVLRHTALNFSKELEKKLLQEEATLKAQNAHYVFFPVEVKVDPDSLVVHIVGDRVFYVGDQVSSKSREAYQLEFTYNGSQLFLKSIVAKELSH